MRGALVSLCFAAGCLVDNPAWLASATTSTGDPAASTGSGDVVDPSTSTTDASTGTTSAPVGDSGPPTGFADTGEIPSDWWDLAYLYRRRVDVHADIAPLASPITVRVDIEVDQGNFPPMGQGIAFATGAGEPLSHEVEYWDDELGVVWLRLDAPDGDMVYLYYGAPGEPPTPAFGDAWADGYVAVWHMTSGVDSTGKGNDLAVGPPWGAIHIGQSGAFGTKFPGIEVVNGVDLAQVEGQAVTLTAWLRSDGLLSARPRIVDRINDAETEGFSFHLGPMVGSVGVSFGMSTTPERWYSQPVLALDEWHFVAVVIEQYEPMLFVIDGMPTSFFLDQVGVGSPQPSGSLPVSVGGTINQAEPFTGLLDEVRIFVGAMTELELQREYLAQTSSATSLGPEETQP